MEEFCGGPFWDEDLTWNTDDPDFTDCFLKTALVWAPCILLVIFAPLDIHYMVSSKYRNIPWGYLNVSRLILSLALISITLADLILAAVWETEADVALVDIITPVVKIVTFILAIILSVFHRRRGIMSSGTIFLFWFFMMLLAIPQFRHEIRHFQRREENSFGSGALSWADTQFVIQIIYFSFLVIQFILHIFSDKTPTVSRFAHYKSEKPSPELKASFVRRLFFLWFDPMTWRGFRKPLESEDMWDINPEDTSESMNPRFDKYWQRNVDKNQKAELRKNKGVAPKQKIGMKTTKGNIVPVLFQTFGGPFYLAGVQKLAIDLLSFAPPQILGLLITFTAVLTIPMWHGILFTVTLLVVALTTALLNGQHQFNCFLVGYRIRTVLISAIYRKSLRLSNAAKRNTTVGEVVNLMSVDAQRFFELIVYLHILWSAPLVIALCMYFLYEVIGVAAFTGLALLIALVPLNAYVATKLKLFQSKQMVKKDERIRMMNEILSGMKVLKLYAWEGSFQEQVEKVRNKELQIIKHAAIANAYVFLLWNMVPFLVTLVSFVAFVFIDPVNNLIDPNVVFVAVSLFNILRLPMTMLPLVITQLMQAAISVKRINKFLNSEELDPNAVQNDIDSSAIRIRDGTFAWNDEETTLKNVNINLVKGDLAAVVGPVGSGKSSLISSLLGDTEKKSGSVNIDGSMAFVAQQAWIQNATLQDNILFGKPLDSVYYHKVLEACALLPDLKILPGGDQTEIGEKGINLSGGQKQRVALARAVYSQADVYLLDDPLSAVDSHVGKHIFDKVIGPNGILAGKTRLLVTHGISYLPQVNTIYVLSHGEITESGEYAKLLAQKGAFAEFIVQHLTEIDEDDEELALIKEVLTDNSAGSKIFERAISVRQSQTKKRNSQNSKNGSLSKGRQIQNGGTASATAPAVDGVGTKLIQKEVSATGSVGIAVYIRYIKSIGWLFTTLTVIGSIGHQAFSVYANTWLSEWSGHPNANAPDVRDLYLGVFGALGGAQGITLFATSMAMAVGCLNAARFLHLNLLVRTLRLPMAFFDTTPLGRIMNRFSKDVDVVDNMLPQIIRAWMIMFFSTLAILIVISISTPIFIAVIVPLAIIYFFIQTFYVATSRQLKRVESVTRSPIYSHFGETIAGQSTIRAYGAELRFKQESEKKVDFNQQCTYPGLVANRWLGIRLEMVGSLVIMFAALFAVLARETISGELVGLSITYALQITGVLSFLVRLTADVETNIVANERMEEYSNEPTEAEWITKKIDPKWPVNGEVKFDQFQLRYREGLDLVLKGVSFNINGGEKIGIVGRTGAGKSSLTMALFRIIESSGGKITIDGLDIADMGLHSLRSRLTIIPQDPVLFAGTLRMNVDPFKAYSDEQIWQSLEHAHLREYVKGTQLGLLHEIAEGGENLSIGQRQLVCLARALLRKTKVLILDEATAAIDLETDDLIQTTIRTQFRDCTILTIAHRLNTIMDSDKVLVLDKGEVAEFDSPQSLLSNRSSIFYGMAKDAGLVGGGGGGGITGGNVPIVGNGTSVTGEHRL